MKARQVPVAVTADVVAAVTVVAFGSGGADGVGVAVVGVCCHTLWCLLQLLLMLLLLLLSSLVAVVVMMVLVLQLLGCVGIHFVRIGEDVRYVVLLSAKESETCA